MKRLAWLVLCWLFVIGGVVAQPRTEVKTPTVAEKTAGMQKFAGFYSFYWDAKAGKVWLEIDQWNSEFLYVEALPAGIGSNDIGLDRGQLGDSQIVRFERHGPRILLIASNQTYRAISNNADERRSVKDAFAESTLWGFEVAAEEGERVLVDATNFYLRDHHGIPGTLQRSQQGQFRLDSSRSAFYLPNTKNFPKNTEVEVTLTFTTDGDPGGLVRSVTPNPQAITVRERVSFVELPGPGYKPRENDPRAGFFGVQYMDFATPITDVITKRYISRHRLQKRDPGKVSEVDKPIIYYVDRGAPEPVRSALIEGASWWKQAFEAAGFSNAFRVEVMPPDMDPMDVRYNVIQWVHRSTRGWSYGSSLEDPRTGEIIQGRVSLGSLRDRQDLLIAEGLLPLYGKDRSLVPKALEQVVLARLRQLSAHEVGHTLGLQHNFAASITGRASVMDYPAPHVKLGADGAPDISAAYAKGIGEWDKVAIAYGYQDFPAATNEKAALDKILRDASDRGLMYLTDQDARPAGASTSVAHLWDNGANAIDNLENMMRVRDVALNRFGENNIREGTPMATLEDALVPLYMGHRYQVEAASKLIGGMDYSFSLRGKGDRNPKIVPPDEQKRALYAVLETLKPHNLRLPESLLRSIPPRPPGYPRNREHFRVRTSPAFDALAPAEAYANHVCEFLFNPERAARIVEFHARHGVEYPMLDDYFDKIITETFRTSAQSGYEGEIQRTVNAVVLNKLMNLAANERASNQVRAVAELKLEQLKTFAAEQSGGTRDKNRRAFLLYVANQIKRFQDDPKKMNLTRPNDPPDGQPIGMDWWAMAERDWCDWR